MSDLAGYLVRTDRVGVGEVTEEVNAGWLMWLASDVSGAGERPGVTRFRVISEVMSPHIDGIRREGAGNDGGDEERTV